MASSFPSTLDSFATSRVDATPMATNHVADHNNYADAINKIEPKVGTGSSTPVANSLLAGTGTGTSGWSTGPTLTGTLTAGGLALGDGALTINGTGATYDATARDIYVSHNITNGSSMGAGEFFSPVRVDAFLYATDMLDTVGSSIGIYSRGIFGVSGAASSGKVQCFTGDNMVMGCGNDLSEHCVYYGWQPVQIGTGFTQTTGPAGKVWFTDYKQSGPIAVQPRMLGGITMHQANHYNGSPSEVPSYGMAICTKYGIGGPTHVTAETFAIDDGLLVCGFGSPNGTTKNVGYTNAIRLGGSGSNWGVTDSKFTNAITITDYTTYGITLDKFAGTTPTAAIAIADGAGQILVGGTSSSLSATALLELHHSTAILDPIMRIGNGAATAGFSVSYQNTSGNHKQFLTSSASAFLTGSAAGDGGWMIATDAKKFLVGGSAQAPVIAVKHNNGAAGELGFFSATTVAKQGATTDLKDALVNYGLLTDGGATPLNLDAGAFAAATATLGTTPAATGTVRIPNSGTIVARNFDNTADVILIGPSTSANEVLHSAAVRFGNTVTMAAGMNIQTNTTTGSIFGQSASAKIGFWGTTAIIQPSGTGETAGFTAGAGTAVNDQSTFTGNVGSKAYRISDIVKALKSCGLIASS